MHPAACWAVGVPAKSLRSLHNILGVRHFFPLSSILTSAVHWDTDVETGTHLVQLERSL